MKMEITYFIAEKGIIIIPMLISIGKIIKNAEFISDKFIPLILMCISIAAAIALMGINADAVIQGVLLAGTAVFGNQMYKQLTTK